MNPEVSVIIPMFNAGATVRQALESVCIQDGVRWEAVVVNDGSTDDGAVVVQEFMRPNVPVRMMSQPNRGLAAARNAGIGASIGTFVHFLDADDWLLPGGLGALLRAAQASSYGASFGGSAWQDERGEDLHWTFEPSCPSVGLDELLECGRFQPACQLIARSTLNSLQFRNRYPGVEDHDLWLRLAEAGVRWAACDQAVCAYRLRSTGMSRDFGAMGASMAGATRESFAHARLRQREHGAIDLSEVREARIIDRIALEHATGSMLQGNAAGAMRLLTRLGRSAKVSAEQAAASAYWMIPFADCHPPIAWGNPQMVEQRDMYVRAACAWWTSLREEGKADGELVERALDALAERAIDERAIATQIAQMLEGGQRVALYGLGRQARLLVPALRARGVEIVGTDDAAPAELRETTLGGVTIPIVWLADALEGAAACILAAERDEAMANRVPTGVRLIRWNEQRRSLASGVRRELQDLAQRTSDRKKPLGSAA